MSEMRAHRVDLKNVYMKKELIDSTITCLERNGNIIERRRIGGGENEETFVDGVELTKRNLKGEGI